MVRIVCAVAPILAVRGCGGGTDAEDGARGETETIAEPTQPDLIAYFLKFPSDEDARGSIRDLEALGFAVNPEYTAAFAEEGEGWLVVERGDALPDIESAEEVLSDVAEKHGGVYDGWEAATS